MAERGRRSGGADLLYYGTGRTPAPAVNSRPSRLIVHLIDGTYELFRHFYGDKRRGSESGRPLSAVAGVVRTIEQMGEFILDHQRSKGRPAFGGAAFSQPTVDREALAAERALFAHRTTTLRALTAHTTLPAKPTLATTLALATLITKRALTAERSLVAVVTL